MEDVVDASDGYVVVRKRDLALGSSSKPSALAARLQVDDELAVERVGDAKQRVDARRPPATLEPGDRGLRRADQLGQLALRQSALLAPLRHLICHCSEEPAAVGRPNPFLQALEGTLAGTAWHRRDAMSCG